MESITWRTFVCPSVTTYFYATHYTYVSCIGIVHFQSKRQISFLLYPLYVKG